MTKIPAPTEQRIESVQQRVRTAHPAHDRIDDEESLEDMAGDVVGGKGRTNGTGSPGADRTRRAAVDRGAKAAVPRRSGQGHVPSGVRLGRDASAKTRRPASAVLATMVSPPPTYAIAIPPVASPSRIGRSAGIASITRPPAATAAPTTRAKRESRSTYTEGDVTVAGR